MKKSLLLLSGLVASSIVLTSFNRPAKDDVGQKYMDAAVNLVDVGEYKLALKVLKDCDRPFAGKPPIKCILKPGSSLATFVTKRR